MSRLLPVCLCCLTLAISTAAAAANENFVRVSWLDIAPSVAFVGQSVRLLCDYEKSPRSTLYALKWYYNNTEFYRWEPKSRQSAVQVFPIPTLNLSLKDCWRNGSQLVLGETELATQGLFKCEVSIEEEFLTDERSARLVVLPNNGGFGANSATAFRYWPSLWPLLLTVVSSSVVLLRY